MLKLHGRGTDPLPQRLHRASTGRDRQTRKPATESTGYGRTFERAGRTSKCGDRTATAATRPTAGHDNHRSPTLHVSLCLRVSTRRHRSLSRASMDWARLSRLLWVLWPAVGSAVLLL